MTVQVNSDISHEIVMIITETFDINMYYDIYIYSFILNAFKPKGGGGRYYICTYKSGRGQRSDETCMTNHIHTAN